MTKKIKLKLDRDTCINCGACIPEAWDHINQKEFLDFNDNNEVHIVGVEEKTEGEEELELEVDVEQEKALSFACEVCPVECLKIKE